MAQRILDTGNKMLTERPQPNVPSNTFDLSHELKTSLNMGDLVPICVMEALPGDRFNISADSLIRFQPLISPMMHRVDARTEWFFVPNRLVWPNWENFISPPTEGFVSPATPTLSLFDNQVPVRSLGDYMGLRPNMAYPDVNALPFAAYQKIYDDWYRDEDLTPSDFQPLSDGDQGDPLSYTKLRKRNWDRDYFTLAKPWPQKGPEVVIPSSTNSYTLNNQQSNVYSLTNELVASTPPGVNMPTSSPPNLTITSPNNNNIGQIRIDGNYPLQLQGLVVDPNVTLEEVPGLVGTINQLRQAEALQGFLEADSRGGTRYIETIKAHFDVNSSDSRLQRPEYLGSTRQAISVSEVVQTSATDSSSTPQGNMAGHGVSSLRSDGIDSYYCEEHGFIIGIMSVLPKTGYQQGVHKMFWRKDRFDYAWPEFANLGEQELKNREIYYTGNFAVDDNAFGYLPRYTEYRTMLNRVSGNFQTDLDFWHMNRIFDSQPLLNNSFIASNPTDRVFAVTGSDVEHVLAQWVFDIKVNRKLPRFVKPNI